jgi:hypothetical protein
MPRRRCAPGSEWKLHRDWFGKSASRSEFSISSRLPTASMTRWSILAGVFDEVQRKENASDGIASFDA